MSEAKTVVLAAGGTGGHMFPAQAVAEALSSRGYKVILTTDARGLRYADGFSDDVDVVVLKSASLAQGSIIKRMAAPFLIAGAVAQAWRKMAKAKPVAVIGFGGYPSFPALLVARMKRIGFFIHEQNAVLGRVNRYFHKTAQAVGCGIWPVEGAGDNAVFVGNPVRATLDNLANAPIPDGDKVKLVVFGGSQGASALSDIVPAAVTQLDESLRTRLYITQQAREGEVMPVLQRYKNADVECEVAVFFSDLPERIADAHFVIARAGASSLAEIATIGRGSVLVPLLSAANDHQRVNAKTLVGAGAAIEHIEGRDSALDLAKKLEPILTDENRLVEMAARAREFARPNAATDFVDIIDEYVARKNRNA